VGSVSTVGWGRDHPPPPTAPSERPLTYGGVSCNAVAVDFLNNPSGGRNDGGPCRRRTLPTGVNRQSCFWKGPCLQASPRRLLSPGSCQLGLMPAAANKASNWADWCA
jgi:hypothetical protein